MSRVEALVGSMRRSVDQRRCIEAACYTDPDLYALEVERVLRPGWHAVARWDSLPEPGDFASLDLFGEPLLLVRDEARKLRVFSRVCLHRAHTIVEGTGNTKRFLCPYHRWSYDRDGSLAAAPLMDAEPDFDRAGLCLPEVRTESWLGFVLINLDRDAEPFAGQLGDLDARLRPLGLEQMVTTGVLEFDSPWNWKVMVDNFMESYHHLGPHAQSLHKSNPAGGTYVDEAPKGPFSVLENPSAGQEPEFVVVQVFPTHLFAVFDGAPIGAWYEMQIDRVDHFHLRVHALASPEFASNADAVRSQLEGTREVHLEDIPVCEGVQRGLGSQLWRPGPLSHHERALTRFHAYLAERLTG